MLNPSLLIAEILAAAGYTEAEIADLHSAGAVAGPVNTIQGSFLRR